MKNIYFLLLIPFLLGSCDARYKSRYTSVPLSKMSAERKAVALDFVETYIKKCDSEEYSEFKGFNISKKFQSKLAADSLKRSCNYLNYKNGKIKVEKLVSAHTTKSPKDFLDVLNFRITTEKSATPLYLHLGMYRDQNFIEMPFYVSVDESHYESVRKKYIKK